MDSCPIALMKAGTPDEVKAYVKELIQVAGKDGGFILTNGCGIDYARPENVQAVMDAGREYGVYQHRARPRCVRAWFVVRAALSTQGAPSQNG